MRNINAREATDLLRRVVSGEEGIGNADLRRLALRATADIVDPAVAAELHEMLSMALSAGAGRRIADDDGLAAIRSAALLALDRIDELRTH